jgi:hypothetical protein
MSSSTRSTSRALVATGAGGLLVLGAAFGSVSPASADDTPPPPPATPTTAAPERPGTLPPAAAPAEPVASMPDYTG